MTTITRLFTSGKGIKRHIEKNRRRTRIFRVERKTPTSSGTSFHSKSELVKIFGRKDANKLIRKKRLME